MLIGRPGSTNAAIDASVKLALILNALKFSFEVKIINKD